MRAPISVIVPTLNAQVSLGACLHGLMEGLDAGLIRELIVCDGGSEDATAEIAKDWGAEVIVAAPSRGGQLRAGCAVAKGDWLLILHADTVLQAGWVTAVIQHMRTTKAGWFSLAFDAHGLAPRMVASWANIRSRFGLPYGDQGLLISRALYDQTGGYQDMPLMEDVAIARALKGQLMAIDAVALTSAAKYQSQGWMRRGGRNLWTLVQYFAGRDVQKLAQAYRRN
jgi:rSAM/selenodomain-associated transferase 2